MWSKSNKKARKDDMIRFSAIYMKAVPSVIEGLLLVLPMINFLDSFFFNPDPLMQEAFSFPYQSFSSVTLDFFVFYIIFAVFNYICFFSRELFTTVFSYLCCLVSVSLALYRFNELFSVKLFFLAIMFITLGMKYEAKKSVPLMAFTAFVFTSTLFYPTSLGIVDIPLQFRELKAASIITYIILLLIVGFFSVTYRMLTLKIRDGMAVNRHLNHIMTEMTEFNQELQEYAKNKGGEAAEEERLRITRDLHDSSGYVFVNIICLMEACCSAREMEWSRVKETFETVRTLASHGLQETRKTLRTIREIQNPMEKGLDCLNEIKNIFQKVTGIKVELDKGNMKSDYGPAVNKVLIRAMQEGLTNSVRHGMATQVIVNFRDDVSYLYMTIKDNGIGSRQVVKGIGLAGMEERLRKLGGELTAESGIEGGFKLEIKIPVIESMMEEYEKSKAFAG